MQPNVYFSDKADYYSLKELFLKVSGDLENPITLEDRVAIKVHFGERGNSRFVSPKYISPIMDSLKKINNNYFLTDTNTLYKGMRTNATDHKKLAIEHGFGDLGADIIIGDGELGDYEEKVKINGRIFSEVKIGKYISDSNLILAISHFKGHNLFGFSGAIKNLGMGCGSRSGKFAMHSQFKPSVNNNCKSCYLCIDECPSGAIYRSGEKVTLNQEVCIGCAKCIAVCNNKAIRSPWFESKDVIERCSEYALGAMNKKKGIFFNFITDITKHCDCAKDSEIICQDIGIVASLDPVALDKASYDLVIKKTGKDIFKETHGFDGTPIFDYCEKIGLGKKEYKLINLY
ncbi:MAG: DUF362 domain-containing protein [Candidatus Nanoarchaeia archaeon]